MELLESPITSSGQWSYDPPPPPPPLNVICSTPQLIESKLSSDWLVVVSVLLLVVINAMVIFGNILVILSVFVSQKLRTSTNYFIVSLAVADLLVGIAVIPYSLTLEVLDVWIFGQFWCQGWLVVDVWMCTASILNLCAISVDRYLAVTRPVQYRSMMTGRRAKYIIFVVWLMSFLICFPPLVGWNGQTSFTYGESKSSLTSLSNYNSSNNYVSLNFSPLQSASRQEESSYLASDQSQSTTNSSKEKYNCTPPTTSCTLFNEKGYVIYSALGSFWVPMLFMLFFYWRIYLVASRTTRALKRGYKSTKNTPSGSGHPSGHPGSPDERVTLRMHRGFAQHTDNVDSLSTAIMHPSNSSSTSSPRFKGRHETFFHIPFRHHKQKPTIIETNVDGETTTGNTSSSQAVTSQLEVTVTTSKDGVNQRTSSTRLNPSRTSDRNRLSPSASVHSSLGVNPASPSSSRAGSARSSATSTRLARSRTNTGKFQARRFHAETKAAKTVGIIVGGFIICWFPFFTAYLVRAFCDDDSCIHPLLMSIFTWLGYCNSAINPVIYGLFSRDFRRAFKTIVCKCTFREETGVSSLIRQIHLPTFLDDEAVRTTSHEEHFEHHLK